MSTSKLKKLIPWSGVVNNRARPAFQDVPALEKMLQKSGLQEFYRESKNLTIVDGYAGYGWFSAALFNSLQPKKMFLLDPSKYAIEPLTQLQKQHPKIIDFSNYDPFQWRSYYPIYEYAGKKYNNAKRDEVSRDFLFTANLSYNRGGELLYQFLLCVLHQNWLQRYGRVRMLVWLPVSQAEKLTHGKHRATKHAKNTLTAYDNALKKVEALKAENEDSANIVTFKSEANKIAHQKRVLKNKKEIKKLLEKAEDLQVVLEPRRFKSTVVRDMTCDYRYLIGGDTHLPKSLKYLKEEEKDLVRQMTKAGTVDLVLEHNPRDEKAVQYFRKGYQDMFNPRKIVSIGPSVLVELTPKNMRMDRITEWFYVVTKMFVASSVRIGSSLELLGPGATLWMSPHLSEHIMKSKITEISLEDMERIVEVFWMWPFKPKVLMDTFESNVLKPTHDLNIDFSIFDKDGLDEDDGEGEGAVEDDDGF